ncbi:GGDEF domain-containing protein [Shewanella sp. KX20019]|uniref:diguanylate cyclase DgcS n=1 Tax=Shewanella sp. KX20019 TaxID=2803864 RepID=UPI0019287361|nr:GGDEF domain-containing protein [Shewanella sp. KX20019]QQX79024.1 GGDEF domain-containing protein [Shewanella sp. KX20019]
MEFGLATEFFPNEYRVQADVEPAYTLELDLVKIIQQLHQHLDPRTVFACFGKIMGQYLPLHGVQLTYKQYHFNWGRQGGYSIEQHLTFADTSVKVNYNLKAPLVPSQAQRLNQLQDLVLQPLFNAIQFQEVSKQAMFDALTNLGNRHYYLEQIKKEIARAQRSHSTFSLVTLDLDNFKQLNDRYGHQLGDEALVAFANMLTCVIRDTDQAFRIGGDEFTILVQGDSQAAAVLCQRILIALEEHSNLVGYQVKTSLGIAQWLLGDTEQSLYQKSDSALYQAKAAGRQCYSAFQPKDS